jgi:hypothetical protein
MRRIAVAAMVTGLVALGALTACSSSQTEVSSGAGNSDPASSGLAPECEAQVFSPPGSAVSGTDGGTNDTPPPEVQNPDIALMSVITTYGQDHADTYGGMWIDRTQPGSPITVGFTEDIDQRRTELLATRAGDHDVEMIHPTMPPLATTVGESGWPVIVVQVRHSEKELTAIQDQVMALGDETLRQLGMSSAGANQQSGYVEMGLVTVTDDARRLLGGRFGDDVCVRQQNAMSIGNEPVDGSVGGAVGG